MDPRGAVALLGALLIAGCAQTPGPGAPAPGGSPVHTFTFQGGPGVCTAAPERPTLQGRPGEIEFKGALTVPNPCHTISARGNVEGNRVTVALTTAPGADMCVECVGELPFQGRVRNLEPGAYNVTLLHNGRPFDAGRIYVPAPNDQRPACGGIAWLQCPGGRECVLEGVYPDATGRCL